MITLTLMMRFILASKSPRRSFFLQKRGYLFHTFPVEISEILDENLSIETAVEDLAMRKSKALVEGGTLDPEHTYVILSADTIVYHLGKVLGKPENEQDAFKTLKSLSGTTHKVITAFCLYHSGTHEYVCDHEVSEVTFRPLSDQEIQDYVATGDPMDKAGSYGIQSLASQFTGGTALQMGSTFQMERRDFVVNFTGTLENIAGLPIDKVEQRLTEKKWPVPRQKGARHLFANECVIGENVFLKNKKLGILGVGNMGQAIVKALLESNTFTADRIHFSNRSAGKIEKVKKIYDIQAHATNEELIDSSDIVIIAVKPQDLEEALEPCRNSFRADQIIISLAAGIDFKFLRRMIPEGHLTRMMLNTPVLVRKGAMGFFSENDLYEQVIRDLFQPMGEVIKLEDGDPFEAFTVASSSGTGFIFEIMSYWQEWIEEHGVSPEEARQIVVQTFLGTAALAQSSKESFEDLQNKVTSKKGMTAAGLESMRSLEIEGLLRMSFNKAALRYKELGSGR